MSTEIRVASSPELRAIVTAEGHQLVGSAATFGSRAKLPGFIETIRSGAFTRAIQKDADVVCLWNHNSDTVLGRTTAGTLHLNQDSRGLHYVVDLPNTQAGRDAHESVTRGDIRGCSFGFQVDKDGQAWSEERDADGNYFVLRTLTNITRLTDVSPVTYPAYENTELSARSEAVVPAELRSAVDAKNARRSYTKSRNLVYVPGMPTVEECIEITLRAEARHKKEQGDIVARRRSLLNSILQ